MTKQRGVEAGMGKVLDILRFQQVTLAAGAATETARRAQRPPSDRRPLPEPPVPEQPHEPPLAEPAEEEIPFIEVPESPERNLAPGPTTLAAPGVGSSITFQSSLASSSGPRRALAGELVVASDPDSAAGAAYGQVARALLALLAAESRRSLLIARLLGPDGGAVVSANLALALAADERRRVLLIDADQHERRLATLFGVAAAPGWGDLLAGAELPLAIQSCAHPGLHVIAAGNRLVAAHAAFRGELLRGLLHRLKADYDVVLVHSPMWSELRVPATLAHACDAVCLVVSRQAQDLSFTVRSAEWLREEGVRLLGSIILPE